jgi:mannose-6-phosphate isomerase
LIPSLSIRKALSIQAHPDKQLAQELYAKRPDLYKDGNHKPEMAIGLTKFEALVGFRPVSEIQENLDKFSELEEILESKVVQDFKKLSDSDPESKRKEKLKNLFSNLMNSKDDVVKSALSAMMSRIHGAQTGLENLLNRVYAQYPGDIGVFCLLFLNYVSLESGQAIFLAANEPHAYLSGDCVECMATSDNVVRSGLTPKFKDVETLVKMLTYNHGPVEKLILSGAKFGKYSLLYDPPIAEFAVVKTSLKGGEVEEMKGFKGPSILIVTTGSGSMNNESLEEGDVFFIGAGTPVSITSPGDITVYQAFCE